ncbi:uncharacterized protein LOC144650399 [Oculina patagonica]
MRSFIVIVILGFLATFTAAASTKRDPQSTNSWRPGKKDDTNLFESRLEDDNDYNSSPSDVSGWDLDDATSQILGDQLDSDYKRPPFPASMPRPGRKRSSSDVSEYNNYPPEVQSQAAGNYPFVRPGRKRRSLIA